MSDEQRRIKDALIIADRFGGIDCEHHKMWVIDQMVRCLSEDYDEWVRKHKDGVEGPDTYSWDTGIAP